MGNEGVYLSKIRSAVASIDFFELRQALKDAVESGISNYDIIKKGILKGIEHSGEIGLIITAEALRNELLDITELEKRNSKTSEKYLGKVIIGTIQGDIHDLGKNILIALLRSTGIDVMDLGVDVTPKNFVECAKSPEVRVVALSSLLSSVDMNIERTIQELEAEGLRKKVKIIIGGGGTSRELAEEMRADAYAKDAIKGFEIIEKWVTIRK